MFVLYEQSLNRGENQVKIRGLLNMIALDIFDISSKEEFVRVNVKDNFWTATIT